MKWFIIYLHISGKAHFIFFFKEHLCPHCISFSLYEDCYLFHTLGYIRIKICIKEICSSVWWTHISWSFLAVEPDKNKWPSSPGCSQWSNVHRGKVVGAGAALSLPVPLWPTHRSLAAPKEEPWPWPWYFYAAFWGNHCSLSCCDWVEDTILKWPRPWLGSSVG